jgi:hypothetical protein
VTTLLPGTAPGDRGALNTLAPTHLRPADLSTVDPKPPVLWIRGTEDVIVSDTSLYDPAHLGALGAFREALLAHLPAR